MEKQWYYFHIRGLRGEPAGNFFKRFASRLKYGKNDYEGAGILLEGASAARAPFQVPTCWHFWILMGPLVASKRVQGSRDLKTSFVTKKATLFHKNHEKDNSRM